MTNIKSRIFKILLIILLIQFIFAIENVTEAASWWNNVLSSAEDFLQTGKNAAGSGQITSGDGDNNIAIATPNDKALQDIINDVYNILFPLGVAITVVIGGALGIKFMLASAEDKAKVKESMIPYVIGCIVIYGAFGIWKLVITIFSALG